MFKKIAAALLAALALFACAACGAPQTAEEKTEEELMAENPLFAQALPAEEGFACGGISFRLTRALVNMSPNDDAPNKTIRVFVDYPYSVKTVTYEYFSVIDPAGERYGALLPDGLDYMGPYRQEGEDGRVTFIVPSEFDNYLLEVHLAGEEPVYVHFDLNDY